MEMQAPPPSADLMVQMLRADPERVTKSADPVKAVEDLAKEAVTETAVQNKQFQAVYRNDKQIYRIAIWVLSALAIIAALGAIGLAYIDITIPESVVALGSASVGALVGLFAPSPTSTVRES